MKHDGRMLLASGGYERSDGLATWWWDGRVTVEQAGVADVDSPSFVCQHPTLPLLYAVSELDVGLLTTLQVADNGSLTVLGSMPTGGAQPCWVTTDPAGLSLLIANYDVSGAAANFAVIGLSEDGIPVGDALAMHHAGSGPVPGRQAGAHVHQAVPTADGNVLVADLGTDELVEYAIEPVRGAARGTVVVGELGRVAMPAGSGPRHIALAAEGRTGFVTGELDGTVTVIRRDGGSDGEPARWYPAGQVTSSNKGATESTGATESKGATVSKGATESDGTDPAFLAPSHIALAARDRFVLAANRGPSTLAVLDVTADLRIVSEVQVAAGPRDFTLAGNTVLVACQEAGVVEVHRIDDRSGEVERWGVLAAGERDVSLPGVSCTAVLER